MENLTDRTMDLEYNDINQNIHILGERMPTDHPITTAPTLSKEGSTKYRPNRELGFLNASIADTIDDYDPDHSFSNEKKTVIATNDQQFSPQNSENGGKDRCSLNTQDSGVDEAPDESDMSHPSPPLQSINQSKLCDSIDKKTPVRQRNPSHKPPPVDLSASPPPHRQKKPNRCSSFKEETKLDASKQADCPSGRVCSSSTAQTVAVCRARAEALKADRLRERTEALRMAEQLEEAAQERARQLRESRQRVLRARDEERRKRVAERRKTFEELEKQRKAAYIAKRQPSNDLPYAPLGRSKSARAASSGCHQPAQGFASDLHPSDPRYCPFGFGSASRREACLTANQIGKKEPPSTENNLKLSHHTISFRQKLRQPDRMSQSAMVFRNASTPSRKPLSSLQPSKLQESTKVTIEQTARGVSKHKSSFQNNQSSKKSIVIDKETRARAFERLTKSVTGGMVERARVPDRHSKLQPPTTNHTAPVSRLKTTARTIASPAATNHHRPSPTNKAGGDRRTPTYDIQGNQPQTVWERRKSIAMPASLLAVNVAGEQRKSIPSSPTRTLASPSPLSKASYSGASGQDASDEYRARMLTQRKLARERREHEENEARVKEAEATQTILEGMARQTVDEAIDCAVAELKAEAIDAAVTQQSGNKIPSSAPAETAAELLTHYQKSAVDRRLALTFSTRSLSSVNLQPSGDSATTKQSTFTTNDFMAPAMTASKDTLSKGLQRMTLSASNTAEETLRRTQSQVLEILSNAASDAAEREERKMRLDRIMQRFRPDTESKLSNPAHTHTFNLSLTPSRSRLDMADEEETSIHSQCTSVCPTTPHLVFKPSALKSVLDSGRFPQNSKAAALLRNRLKTNTDELPVDVSSSASQLDTDDEFDQMISPSNPHPEVVTFDDIEIDNPAMLSSNIEINLIESQFKRHADNELVDLDVMGQNSQNISSSSRIAELFPLDRLNNGHVRNESSSSTLSATTDIADETIF